MRRKLIYLNLHKIITKLVLLNIFLSSSYSTGQVNNLYNKFNESNSTWSVDLKDGTDTITLGNFITKDGIEFHGSVSKHNRTRFGWIKTHNNYDTIIYCGIFNQENFIGLRYSKRFDNIYRGNWNKNTLSQRFDSPFLNFFKSTKGKTGKYIVFYKRGAVYYGDIVKGRRQGKGIYISKSGYVYFGKWNRNKRFGNRNTVIFKNGDGFRGRWEKDYIKGFGELYKQTGIINGNQWKEKKQQLFKNETIFIEKRNFYEKLETNSVYYLKYDSIIKDNMSVPEPVTEKKEKIIPLIKSPDKTIDNEPKKTNKELILNKKNDSSINKNKQIRQHVIQNSTKTQEIKSDSWFIGILKFIWKLLKIIFVIVIISIVILGIWGTISDSSKTTSTISKDLNWNQSLSMESDTLVQKNKPITKKEKLIDEYFTQKYPTKPKIFWVDDKHRTHPWSIEPGGCTVVVIIKKQFAKSKRCLGYDKIKRPYEYTSKIINPFISNHSSSKHFYTLEDYLENIYIAEQLSTNIKEVWNSNMGSSLKEILMKYRIK